MEQSRSAMRKKRVMAQQNMVTLLCLACMVFTVGWSVFAAAAEARKPAADATADKNSSATADSSSQAEDDSANSYSGDNSEESSKAEETSSYAPYYTEDDHPYAVPEDTEDDLSDAVFIGDSRIVGMMNSSDKPLATFICAVGLNIDTVLTSSDIAQGDGSVGTLEQALSGKDFGRVFVSFGTNEMGWPYTSTFEEHYANTVRTIQGYQPNAEIYLIGILPLTRSQDYDGDDVNNVNARKFSASIENVARELGVHYLDCSEAVADEDGYLPDDASSDGIHMGGKYCLYWQNYIIDHT